VEEDFLPESFHHLDAWLDHHEGRGDRQAQLNPDAHLGPGRGSAHGQKECERDGEMSHGGTSLVHPLDESMA
jgi:type II secretory pathway component PulL